MNMIRKMRPGIFYVITVSTCVEPDQGSEAKVDAGKHVYLVGQSVPCSNGFKSGDYEGNGSILTLFCRTVFVVKRTV